MKNFEFINCGLCESYKSKNFLVNLISWEHSGKFTLVKCTNCGLIYLNPRPTIKQISKYYPNEEYWGWDTYGDQQQLRKKSFNPVYTIINNYKNKGSILDIGTGSGLFLTEFKEKGWNVAGTELSDFAGKIASKKNNIDIKKGDFLDLIFQSASFDVISLNNVFEHLHSPKETLIKAHMVLKKNGLIVITVPNIDSFGFKIFGRNWHPLQPPRHLYHYSKDTLNKLLENTGFKVEGYLYDYKAHIIYSLFESFRFSFSPRFKKTSVGGLLNENYKWKGIANLMVKEIGKIVGIVFAYVVYFMEIIFSKPEVITIYAKKKQK